MAKNFNYRKYYKEYYGIDFGSEYDIHHIDFDRSNNDIWQSHRITALTT